MQRIALAFVLTFLVFLIVPLVVYAPLAALMELEPPTDEAPAVFMASVAVQKLGHAAAFVLIFAMAARALRDRWLTYALLWWLMFALGEVGFALGWTVYSWPDAIGGIVAEAVYLPLAGWITHRLIAPNASSAAPRQPTL